MKLPISLLFLLSSLLNLTAARFNQNSSVAVYWGQAEAGEKKQNELSYYCQSDSVDIVVLAFVSSFGRKYSSSPDGFVLNLSNMCNEDGDGHFVCPDVGKDIRRCQGMGKKVLLSIGGEADANEMYGFEHDDEAREFAQTLWNYFGEGDSEHRPFGSSSVDGFDFDIETEDQVGYLALANELKRLTEDHGSKPYLFTAAPQCPLPEENLSDLLDNFEMDYIYVQFYNNERCEIGATGYNYAEWAQKIANNGHEKTKMFIGLPSAKQAAGSGFVKDVNRLYDSFITLSQPSLTKDVFGGFMFWDASRGFDHVNRDSYEKSYIYRAWSTFNDTEVDSSSSGALLTISSDTTPSATSRPGFSNHKNDGIDTLPLSSTFSFWVFFITACLFSTL